MTESYDDMRRLLDTGSGAGAEDRAVIKRLLAEILMSSR
jgi:hypothetical protein